MRGAEEAGHLAEIAHHWFEGRDMPRALVASIKAGEAAEMSSAFVEAYRQDERALELWDVVPDPRPSPESDSCRAASARGPMPARSGEVMVAAGLLREGVAILESTGDAVRTGLLDERLGRALFMDICGKLDELLQDITPLSSSAPEARPLTGWWVPASAEAVVHAVSGRARACARRPRTVRRR